MARVEYKSTAPGVLLDRAGNARSGITVTHSGGTVYAGSAGGTAYGSPLTTNADGEVPGWLDPGVYTMTDATTGKSWTFEVGGATTTSNEPSTTEKAALAGSSGTPSGSNKYVTDADPRNTDARIPILTVGAVQAGVLAAPDFKVTQRAAGANQSVDVAGSTLNGGGALVRETATGRLRYVTQATASVNLPVGPAHATLPRIDKVYVTTAGVLGYVEGTATSGATLDNMTGQPATPSDALLLEALLRPAATNNVTTGNMRDRRSWATGAQYLATRLSTDVTVTSTTFGDIDATLFAPRLEILAAFVQVSLFGSVQSDSASSDTYVTAQIDGAYVDGVTSTAGGHALTGSGGAFTKGAAHLMLPVTAGSRVIKPQMRTSVGATTARLFASATTAPARFLFRELIGMNANNT